MPWRSSGVNIEGQALAEVIMRPKYGAVQMSDITKAVNPGGLTEFHSISGKGVTYIQWIITYGNDIQRNDYGVAVVDGVAEGTPTFNDALTAGLIYPVDTMPTLGVYDEVNFRYSLYMGGGMTFESSEVGYYVETHGRTPTVRKGLLYALV